MSIKYFSEQRVKNYRSRLSWQLSLPPLSVSRFALVRFVPNPRGRQTVRKTLDAIKRVFRHETICESRNKKRAIRMETIKVSE